MNITYCTKIYFFFSYQFNSTRCYYSVLLLFNVVELKISQMHSTDLQMHFSWKQSYQCNFVVLNIHSILNFTTFLLLRFNFKPYIFQCNRAKNESLKNRTYSFQRVTASTRETKVMVTVSHATLIDEVFSVPRKKTSLAYTVQPTFLYRCPQRQNRLVKDLTMVSTFPSWLDLVATIILLMT